MAYKITYCTLLPMQFYRLFVVQLEAAEAAVKEAEQIRQGYSIQTFLRQSFHFSCDSGARLLACGYSHASIFPSNASRDNAASFLNIFQSVNGGFPTRKHFYRWFEFEASNHVRENTERNIYSNLINEPILQYIYCNTGLYLQSQAGKEEHSEKERHISCSQTVKNILFFQVLYLSESPISDTQTSTVAAVFDRVYYISSI